MEEQALKPKKSLSLLEQVAEHRVWTTIIIFIVMGLVIGSASGIFVSAEVANNLRHYLTALFR